MKKYFTLIFWGIVFVIAFLAGLKGTTISQLIVFGFATVFYIRNRFTYLRDPLGLYFSSVAYVLILIFLIIGNIVHYTLSNGINLELFFR